MEWIAEMKRCVKNINPCIFFLECFKLSEEKEFSWESTCPNFVIRGALFISGVLVVCFSLYINYVRMMRGVESEGFQILLNIFLFLLLLIGIIFVCLSFLLELKKVEDIIVFFSFVALPMLVMELLILDLKAFLFFRSLRSKG